MKRMSLALLFAVSFASFSARAQESNSTFNFLSLPASAHATALGGKNVSLIEDDGSLVFQNPALLQSVSDNTMGLNFLTYMRGSKAGSANYARIAGERGTWGLGAQFVGYGTMTETNELGEALGTMSALDLAISGTYSYALSEGWAAGASGKMLYSKYASYTSFALAVDLGLNYYDDEHGFSFSTVFANLGGQIKAFGEEHERLPFSLDAGFTKRVAHAPLRVSLTVVNLTQWKKSYYATTDSSTPGFGKVLMNHFNVGVDILPTEQLWIALGYNFRRANEMKAAGSSHAAGLTMGAGVNVKRFKLGVAYAKYHVSAPSLSFSIAYSI